MSSIMKTFPEVKFSRTDRKKKSCLMETVLDLPFQMQDRLRTYEPDPLSDKEVEHGDVPSGLGMTAEYEDIPDEDKFLKPADQETINRCICDFIKASSNEALGQRACMVCAREMWAAEISTMATTDIPNAHLLAPCEFHPAHKLTSGMLLELEVMEGPLNKRRGGVCNECMRHLSSGTTPPLSLANAMWIGEIPDELDILSLPERILVARYLPAAFIVKLFPKKKGAAHWPVSGMNSGMKGNVSTYKLNTEDIADMVNLNEMPPPSKILASTIGVTIIGPKNLPERTMPGFLKVRRDRVRKGLGWLCEHNPIYAAIKISETRLSDLPVDGIPREIIESTRYSDDMEQLERERAGYVVEDGDFEEVDMYETLAEGESI